MKLRVLVVHNRYLNPGGEDESFAAEVGMLRAHGHTVDEYVLDNRRIAGLGRIRTALRTVWSGETYRTVRRLIRDNRYDLVCAQNIFPLVSPSIYYAARSMHVPVVQTIRNFRLLCVNGLFLRNGRVCEDCLGRSIAWPGIRHACYRGSRVGSAVVAGMTAIHRLAGTWRYRVDAYIALNEFVRSKHVAGGIPSDRLVVKPNFLAEDPGMGTGSGDYAVFAGRLSPEKGIDLLVEAWRLLERAPPLKVLGSGPLFQSLAAQAATVPSLELLGHQPNAEVIRWLKSARALVFASRWYENFPRVILEALGCGVPVIAPRLGAMESLVRHGETGLLYEAGNARELADAVAWLWAHQLERDRMARAARQDFLDHYTAHANHDAFMRIWERIQTTPAKQRAR